jgi:hypothetical protein
VVEKGRGNVSFYSREALHVDGVVMELILRNRIGCDMK